MPYISYSCITQPASDPVLCIPFADIVLNTTKPFATLCLAHYAITRQPVAMPRTTHPLFDMRRRPGPLLDVSAVATVENKAVAVGRTVSPPDFIPVSRVFFTWIF